MKNCIKLKLMSLLFFVGLVVSSCVKDEDFDTPPVNFQEPQVDVNTSIEKVKEMYGGFEPVEIVSGEDSEKPMYLVGYVVSDDETGNFYKTLVIQDSIENPTHGISISTDATSTYLKYEPGRKVYVRVDGLYIGEYAGLPTIGTQNGTEIGRIDADEFEDRVLRSGDSETLVPNVVTINEISDANLNTLVQFENVEFTDDLIGEAYGNVDNTYSVNRTIENCDGATIIMRNSGYSDFKNQLLPEGKGTLTAVFSKYNSDYQLFIRDTTDVQFDDVRCGEEPLDPGVIFFEDFESGTAYENVDLENWTNVNVNGGENLFQFRSYNNNMYAQTSAYNTDENPYEAWLVTPGVEINSGATATLNFETNDGYYNGDALTAYVSTDYSGNVSSATWTELNATYASGDTDGYGDVFVPSGDIDLSAYAGQTVYVAFKYEGASNGVTSTYQVDNVKISVE